MKKLNLIGTYFLSVALAAALAGCKHGPTQVTTIPNYNGAPESQTPPGQRNDAGAGGAINPAPPPIASNENIPEDPGRYGPLLNGDHNEDAEKFKADTVYFDFDSSTIKPSEEAKLQDVAAYFKNNTRMEALIITGNCDERGTEKYNLSLGERRALAAREFMANLGVDPARLKTVTYGASRPVDSGHDEAAWKQNRRDEFILVTPK